jgi:hypothetical protein
MPRFCVTLEGGPVFLTDPATTQLARFGFFTTRWVQAATVQEATSIACKLVIEELAAKGRVNPPDQPLNVTSQEVVQLSWIESLRQRGTGGGFSFFPEEEN